MPKYDSEASDQLSPYGSAHDLPSFREMEKSLKGFKLLTKFIAEDQRSKVRELEREFHRLPNIVDHFYERLGPRNWIFHDLLNVDSIESILIETKKPEESEQRLIELYQDKETMDFWLMRICAMDGLRQRAHQIERARKHYYENEFGSCVLQLIAVMDGFVNDFQPDLRKGLTAREPDEMAAWDSVVGHHMGLTHALETFRKTIKKRIDEEVYELYRNGIVHGSVVRFDDVIVATKAWNMLFAVADWATATLESEKPEEPQPTLRETLRQIRENQRVREQLDAWEPSRLALDDAGFEDLEIYQLTDQFFGAWKGRNFGHLTRFDDRFHSKGENRGQLAGEMRELFNAFELTDFAITDIENSAPVIWLARGTATVNDEHGSFECRWLLQDIDGNPALGKTSGEWRLVFCGPSIWRRDD